jgi:hypothetical protein
VLVADAVPGDDKLDELVQPIPSLGETYDYPTPSEPTLVLFTSLDRSATAFPLPFVQEDWED